MLQFGGNLVGQQPVVLQAHCCFKFQTWALHAWGIFVCGW
jgi:hypothetical protein